MATTHQPGASLRYTPPTSKTTTKKAQYLDLVGDPDWPKDKFTKRIRSIRDEQARLQRQLDQTDSPDYETGRAAQETALELLTRPDELYRLASKRARRVLNQALFTRLYIDVDEAGPIVSTNEPTEPFAPLLGAYTTSERDSGGTRPTGRYRRYQRTLDAPAHRPRGSVFE